VHTERPSGFASPIAPSDHSSLAQKTEALPSRGNAAERSDLFEKQQKIVPGDWSRLKKEQKPGYEQWLEHNDYEPDLRHRDYPDFEEFVPTEENLKYGNVAKTVDKMYTEIDDWSSTVHTELNNAAQKAVDLSHYNKALVAEQVKAMNKVNEAKYAYNKEELEEHLVKLKKLKKALEGQDTHDEMVAKLTPGVEEKWTAGNLDVAQQRQVVNDALDLEDKLVERKRAKRAAVVAHTNAVQRQTEAEATIQSAQEARKVEEGEMLTRS